MSEFNIFEELVKLQTSSANIVREIHDIDYDFLFNADNRHPEANEVTVEELENTTPEKFREIVMKGSSFREVL